MKKGFLCRHFVGTSSSGERNQPGTVHAFPKLLVHLGLVFRAYGDINEVSAAPQHP